MKFGPPSDRQESTRRNNDCFEPLGERRDDILRQGKASARSERLEGLRRKDASFSPSRDTRQDLMQKGGSISSSQEASFKPENNSSSPHEHVNTKPINRRFGLGTSTDDIPAELAPSNAAQKLGTRRERLLERQAREDIPCNTDVGGLASQSHASTAFPDSLTEFTAAARGATHADRSSSSESRLSDRQMTRRGSGSSLPTDPSDLHRTDSLRSCEINISPDEPVESAAELRGNCDEIVDIAISPTAVASSAGTGAGGSLAARPLSSGLLERRGASPAVISGSDRSRSEGSDLAESIEESIGSCNESLDDLNHD